MNDLNIHKRLRVYEFNDKYIKFLHSFDSKVHFPTGISYTTSVKYIGIIASNSMVIYFAPMSSDKNQFYKHKIQANTFEKLMTPGTIAYPSIYVGVLLLNNQIPVNITKREKILLSVDPYSQKNKQYGNLLALELQWLNKYRQDIYNKSNNCLSNTITYEEKRHCCNFKLLERAANVYDENNELVKERILAYPKVFSDKENENFFNKVLQISKSKQNDSGGGSSGVPNDEIKTSAQVYKEWEEKQKAALENSKIEFARNFDQNHTKKSKKERELEI